MSPVCMLRGITAGCKTFVIGVALPTCEVYQADAERGHPAYCGLFLVLACLRWHAASRRQQVYVLVSAPGDELLWLH